ncbi:MAG: hypothetical protein FVQ81_03415 [Candidatus Glassbacteria bacterium]|nr:hypothetical protein [Candidatus Glassbacteria bacterium]
MYKTTVIITLVLISLLSLQSLIIHGRMKPLVIRTVTAEHSEASSTSKPYSLDFVRDSGNLFYRLSSNFKQGRVDIALYDDKGKYLNTMGAAGNFTCYFPVKDTPFKAGKSFKIDVIEKSVIGSYKFEVSQLPPFTMGWSIHFMLFAAFITSSVALLILGWLMYSRRGEQGQVTAQPLA